MHNEETIRKAQELAVETMRKSLSENPSKPHPYVGAVVLFPSGEMVACHRGELSDGEHAEFGLLERKCKEKDLSDAIVFTTLEPCYCRNKPKEPCCVRLKKRHVKYVYIGIDDPDPTVAGQGKGYLERNGINIAYFPRDLQNKIKQINEVYLKDAMKRASEPQNLIKKESKEELPYLKRTCVLFDPNDISERELNKFAKKANIDIKNVSIVDSLSSIGLTRKNGDSFEYTNAFVLLFSKKPSKYISNSIIKLKYRESDAEIDEPLIKVTSVFAKWLEERIPYSTIRGNDSLRESKYKYPSEPLLEALTNALVHRDYSIEGAHIQVVLDDDHAIVRSPGSVINPQNIADLNSFDAASIVRNYEINYVFRIMEFVENNNFGMDKFKKLPLVSHLPSPVFSYKEPILSASFYFSFKALVDNVRYNYPDELDDDEICTLEIMRSVKPLANNDLLKIMNLPNSKSSQRILTELKEKNLVVSKGKTKGTVYFLFK